VFDREFPRADVVVAHGGITTKHWRGMRQLWNNGKHGNDEMGNSKPDTPLMQYDKHGNVFGKPST
jgi:hypothetical protein